MRCIQDETPGVIINSISGTTTTGSIINAEVVGQGTGSVSVSGVVWNTGGTPTLSDSYTSDGLASGPYSSNISGLSPNTTYHVRAYATNEHGTSYSEEVMVKTMNSTVSDIDGNMYFTVIIGTQEWMAENIKTSKFNDGTDIPYITSGSSWFSAGFNGTSAYCWYLNDESNYKQEYGALYNWFTVSAGSLCPSGWHVPTNSEWNTLSSEFGGLLLAGGELKEFGQLHWIEPNYSTNLSGFTALPGGFRHADDGFSEIGAMGYWWSSIETSPGSRLAYLVKMTNNKDEVSNFYHSASHGMSVRCIKD